MWTRGIGSGSDPDSGELTSICYGHPIHVMVEELVRHLPIIKILLIRMIHVLSILLLKY